MSFSSLNDFLDNIVKLLRENLDDNITVNRHFPPKTKPHPLNRITVSIGVNTSSLSSKCIGDALTSTLSGKELTIGIEVAVYVPLSMNSVNAYSVLDRIFSVLSANEKFGIVKKDHGVLSANRATGSFELHSTLTSILYETEE